MDRGVYHLVSCTDLDRLALMYWPTPLIQFVFPVDDQLTSYGIYHDSTELACLAHSLCQV